jgi:ubiquinone biosynthesis O-methyltransferase
MERKTMTLRSVSDGVGEYGYTDARPRCHHTYVLPAIAQLLPLSPHLEVLDAGCGNGSLAAWLFSRGHNVIGIDIAEDGIEFARLHHSGPRFFVRSVYDTLHDITPEGKFDVIVSSEVIEHIFAPQKFVANLAQSLKPGGKLIITTPYHGYLKNLSLSLLGTWDRHFHPSKEGGHIKFFSERTMTDLLKHHNFINVTFRNAGRLPWLWKSLVCRAERRA